MLPLPLVILILVLVQVLACPLVVAQQPGVELSLSLPLPELSFQDEEEAPATEYLVEKPEGYLMLPQWQDEDRTAIDLGRPVNLGGGLWPGQEALLPDIASSFRSRSSTLSNGFRRTEDPRLALPNVERVSPQIIPAAYLPYYFDSPPKRFLKDVQRLLTDSEWQYTDWYLTYHANECQFKLNVMLFSPEEQIPESVSGQQLLNDWFPDQDHVLAFYFHGRPDRVQVFFPAILTEHFPDADFQQNLMEAVDSATRADTAGAQLDEFCQKLGTWLVWWEKRLKVSRPGLASTRKPSPLASNATPATGMSSTAVSAPADRGLGSMLWGLIGALVVLAGGVLFWGISSGLKKNRPKEFPQRRLVTRLGAPHSGGGGVVLTFGARNE